MLVHRYACIENTNFLFTVEEPPMLMTFEMLEWPETSKFRTSTEFKIELEKFAEDCPRSLLFNFRETKDGEVIKALESPACEFVRATLLFLDKPGYGTTLFGFETPV